LNESSPYRVHGDRADDDDEYEKDEDFTVVLTDPTGGASFFATTDGGSEEEICTVTILNDDDRATKLVEALRMFRLDADQLDLGGEDCAQSGGLA